MEFPTQPNILLEIQKDTEQAQNDENESHNSELGNTIQPALTNFIDKEPSQPAVLREVQEEKA